jgi:hypothetical protein
VIFVSAVVIAFSNWVMSARSVAVRAVAMFVWVSGRVVRSDAFVYGEPVWLVLCLLVVLEQHVHQTLMNRSRLAPHRLWRPAGHALADP